MTRNIVLLTIDSLRADHCGFLGGKSLTPTMDELAETGLVFENTVATGPRTPSSMPQAFTGEPLPPNEDGTEGDYWQRRRAVIRRHMNRHRTIAERLSERGYTTVGVTVNPWTQGTDFDTGFDKYLEINSDTLGTYGPLVFRGADRLLNGTRTGTRVSWPNKREWFIRWTDFYDRIESALESADRPYFLWVFLLDTHQPYVTPAQFREESSALGMYYASFSELSRNGSIPDRVDTRLRRAYRDSVRSVDAFLARLWSDNRDSDPILVVHSDHGEAFGDHGTYGHEREIYRENLQVPLFVANLDTRCRYPRPLSLGRLPDIVTELADWGGVDPNGLGTDYALSSTEGGESIAASGARWKYISTSERTELYCHDWDPHEQTNLLDSYPEVGAAFETLVERRRSDQRERGHITDAVEAVTADRKAPKAPEHR